ncbi:MAG TPA: hypothetical protein VKB58_04055 [Terriglobales bacterium]|jgi:hypothetical protein|nr:hypothetical protein [Terriglobales bacterium]
MIAANNLVGFKSDSLYSLGATAGLRFIRHGNGRMLRQKTGARSKLAPSMARPNLFSGD